MPYKHDQDSSLAQDEVESCVKLRSEQEPNWVFMQSVYCVYSILTNIKIIRKISHKIPKFLTLSGSRLIVHAQVDGRMDRRTDKHNVF